MAVTLAQYHVYIEATHVALAAGDRATALTNARAAMAVLMGLPNRSELGVEVINLERDLRDLIAEIRKMPPAGQTSPKLGSISIDRKPIGRCS